MPYASGVAWGTTVQVEEAKEPAVNPALIERYMRTRPAFGGVNTEDPVVSMLLETATKECQEYTGRSLITQKWALVLDRWPVEEDMRRRGRRASRLADQYWDGTRDGPVYEAGVGRHELVLLPFAAPAQSVDAVRVFGKNDAQGQEVDAADYEVNLSGEPAAIALLNLHSVLVSSPASVARIRIQYTAGFGDTHEAVPMNLQVGILRLATYLNENRGEAQLSTFARDSDILEITGAAALWRGWRLEQI